MTFLLAALIFSTAVAALAFGLRQASGERREMATCGGCKSPAPACRARET